MTNMYFLFTWNVKGFLQCISYYKCFNLYYRCILLCNARILRNEFIMQSHMTWISRLLLVVCINVFSQLCFLTMAGFDVRIYFIIISEFKRNIRATLEYKNKCKRKFFKNLFYLVLWIGICLNHPNKIISFWLLLFYFLLNRLQ